MTDKNRIIELENLLIDATEGFEMLSSKQMFGCYALFANNSVFALVWKHGQIGVKLTNPEDHQKLISMKGAGPWKAGPMVMSQWVLVPESVQKDVTSLLPWVKKAHAQALLTPAKAEAAKKAKKSPAKKTVAKTTVKPAKKSSSSAKKPAKKTPPAKKAKKKK